MFRKKLEDVELKMSHKGLLSKAVRRYKKVFEGEVSATLRDKHGKVGYVIEDGLLVAKKSPYGNIVSVNKGIWQESLDTMTKIIMYIDSSKYFYAFRPWLIRKTELNHRGKIEMVNFDIGEGINLLREREGDKETKEKHKEYAQKRLIG